MQKIITATDKEYDVRWCGKSTIDQSLRFGVVGKTMQEVLVTFTNPVETATLTNVFDSIETVYTGFTVFKGVDLGADGSIAVALMEETQ